MKTFILSCLYVALLSCSYAQSFQKRLILFGDAGEINSKQTALMDKAESLVIRDSTIVFYLGDNVYPKGMGLEGEEKVEGIKSLEAQLVPFRTLNVPIYFMAGNHDWNVSKPGGLEKLKAQEEYLNSLNDGNIKFVPTAGELGPVSFDITKDIVAIIYDSEYWLYPYHTTEVNVAEQKTVFYKKLTQLFDQNKDKTILVLSHHPMISYGEHSLSFGWKQHIFPFTRLNKNLYIPLPVVGSIYPLWRGQWFKSAEDIPSTAYQALIDTVMKAQGDHKNVLFGSGHDHGLQYIDNGSINQIVSGSGSKTSFISNNKNLKFKSQDQGFCVVDCMDDNSLIVSYYTFKGGEIDKGFEVKLVKN